MQKLYTDEQESDAADTVSRAAFCPPHEILCVCRSATESDIKTAFRQQALKFHPDKNSAPTAAEAFLCISTACAQLLESFSGHSSFGAAPIVPTSASIATKATITPSVATIIPTGAFIRPNVESFDKGCLICLGCGKFFDSKEALDIHKLQRYNCTIHLADRRQWYDDYEGY